MRYLRYAFLAALAVVLITVALANREPVTLRALSADLAQATGYSWSVTLPLFLVIFAAILAGVVIGFVWEWFREHKHRAAAATHRRDRDRLEREVSRLKSPGSETGDEVLALLESSAGRR